MNESRKGRTTLAHAFKRGGRGDATPPPRKAPAGPQKLMARSFSAPCCKIERWAFRRSVRASSVVPRGTFGRRKKSLGPSDGIAGPLSIAQGAQKPGKMQRNEQFIWQVDRVPSGTFESSPHLQVWGRHRNTPPKKPQRGDRDSVRRVLKPRIGRDPLKASVVPGGTLGRRKTTLDPSDRIAGYCRSPKGLMGRESKRRLRRGTSAAARKKRGFALGESLFASDLR